MKYAKFAMLVFSGGGTHCGCSPVRCVGPDYTRRMRCPACKDPRLLYFMPGQPSFVPTSGEPTDTPWTCHNPACGKKFADRQGWLVGWPMVLGGRAPRCTAINPIFPHGCNCITGIFFFSRLGVERGCLIWSSLPAD